MIFALAEMLHKSVSEVMEFSLSEVEGWLAYLEIKQEYNNANTGK